MKMMWCAIVILYVFLCCSFTLGTLGGVLIWGWTKYDVIDSSGVKFYGMVEVSLWWISINFGWDGGLKEMSLNKLEFSLGGRYNRAEVCLLRTLWQNLQRQSDGITKGEVLCSTGGWLLRVEPFASKIYQRQHQCQKRSFFLVIRNVDNRPFLIERRFFFSSCVLTVVVFSFVFLLNFRLIMYTYNSSHTFKTSADSGVMTIFQRGPCVSFMKHA